MHVPYNFGHTIERVAFFPEHTSKAEFLGLIFGDGPGTQAEFEGKKWKVDANFVKKHAKPGAELWGHFSPDLQLLSNKTGCNMYFTPPKYWPTDLAKKYFGKKKIFGLLRDPAERLVAMFRGNIFGYGGGFGEWSHQRCDVNAGVKRMMKEYKKSGNKFFQECAFLPQSEYFEGDFAIDIPVDVRRFPESMNEVFEDHGYSNLHIRQKDIVHVHDCWHIWSANLDEETKGLIREVYKADYDLLCKTFGYCNPKEDTCVRHVEKMCPPHVLGGIGYGYGSGGYGSGGYGSGGSGAAAPGYGYGYGGYGYGGYGNWWR